VYCPRCGTENAESDRFCRSCGADLRAKPSSGEREQWRTRVRDGVARLIGRSRRERIITGATVLAIVVALISFLALKPDDETPEANPAADAACVNAKREVANAATRAARTAGGRLGSYAASVVEALVEFRSEVRRLVPAVDAAELDAALLDTAVQAGTLGRLARAGNQAAISDQAARVGAATRRVDAAIDDLGLSICADLRIVPAPQTG
jgi:hypothetical protein